MNDVAQTIASARLNGEKLHAYPCDYPVSPEDAYTLQNAVTAALNDEIAGWKIGCTSAAAQQALNAAGPFFGPVLKSRRFESGAELKLVDTDLAIVEAEVALVLASDLPPKQEAYSLEEIQSAIASVCPTFELVNRRLPGDIAEGGVHWAVVDGGLNDALVVGAGITDLPMEALPHLEVSLQINGVTVSNGLGGNALGGAHKALQWLADEFSQKGRTLHAGQIVSTGLTTEIVTATPGDTFEAIISRLGTVKAVFI
ncbi:MAG: 2-keto-4-pentenoate hydratase [Hyphomicrobiales bacterium]